MKVVTIVGARPQFVKAAAVSREIAKTSDIVEVIVHTGQHFDAHMSDVFFQEMEIPRPDYFLDINSLQHGAMTGRMLEKIEEALQVERPDKVLVYGDTNSTLAGALAARKLQIGIVHVEAGLRSFNMNMPEEINRILTDRISDVLCCPTDNAVGNLLREGFSQFPSTVLKTGDVMQDAALYYGEQSAIRSNIVKRLALTSDAFALCTIHRQENTDDVTRLTSLIAALNQISRDCPIVMPIHPRTRKMIDAQGLRLEFSPIEPVGYFDMLELLKACRIVLTDSGGLQKEAFFFGKPCVTLRDETEWVELCECGANMLVGWQQERVVRGFQAMIGYHPKLQADLYGGGQACRRVVEAVLAA